MRVGIVGQGYVGLTAAVGLARAGHSVIGIERDTERLGPLLAGHMPLYEPGLECVLTEVIGDGSLRFQCSLLDSEEPFDALLVTVATPTLLSGAVDLDQVRCALYEIGSLPAPPRMVVMKSTIPPGTSRHLLRETGTAPLLRDRYVYNPEFLSQGSALHDWQQPDRIVVGTWNQGLLSSLRELYRGIDGVWITTTPTNAELIKYAANAFLATKISLTNEIASLCERVGADIDSVVEGIGHDSRIGHAFLRPGLGYGDSCLPKDVQALIHVANGHGQAMRVLEAVSAVNSSQRLQVVQIVRRWLTRLQGERPVVAVLGLSYEPWSDDMRAAPSRTVVPELARLGVSLRAWDPILPPSAVAQLFPGVDRCHDIQRVLAGAGAAVILTEYPEIQRLDWTSATKSMTSPRLVVDGKNCLSRQVIQNLDAEYCGIGRLWLEGDEL